MTADPMTLAVIAAMAAATFATRIVGIWLAGRFVPRGRLRRAVEAIPASILIAVITPLVAGGGPAGWLAGAATALAAWRFPLSVAVVAGVAAAALFRNVL